MKNFILFLLIGFIVLGCAEEQDFFTVSGEISNANGEKLYLVELKTTNVAIVDSIILNDEGVFSFKGQTDIPKFYALRISSENYLTLIINPFDQIHIIANGKDLANKPKITGSPESDAILNLRTKLENSVHQIDSLGFYFKSVIGTRDEYKLRDSLSKISREIIQTHEEFTKQFIENNKNSLAGLMALYQQIAPRRYVLNPTDHYEYFKLIDSSLMAKYPNSEAVKGFHNQFLEIKRQQNIENNTKTDLAIGSKAPEIALPNPNGDTILLSSLKGKYVLLDFWASWCRPCRIENPHLVKNYEKYNQKGFEIFQVSLDKKKESWLDAIEKDRLNWYQVSDLKYWNSEPAELYQVRAIPANFLLDKNGKIIAKNLRGDALEAKLSEIFD